MHVTFHTDAAEFLRVAGPLLEFDPLQFSIIATVATRFAAHGRLERPFWFASISGPSGIEAVSMRTHPDAPHAGYAPSLTLRQIEALALALKDRGELVPAWNGNLEAATALCRQFSPTEVAVRMHTRLFELHEVVWPARPRGELRQATAADLDLIVEWVQAFHHDADLQGQREPGPASSIDRAEKRAEIARSMASRDYWLWEVDGVPTHLTGVSHPAFGVSRLGPVYTPARHRGRGYAAWVVAQVSQAVLDLGNRPCLYTDQANPVSNKVYESIGYRRVQDEGEVVSGQP